MNDEESMGRRGIYQIDYSGDSISLTATNNHPLAFRIFSWIGALRGTHDVFDLRWRDSMLRDFPQVP